MPTTSPSTQRINDAQALALLREWQKESGLRDWTLSIKITPEIAPLHGHVRVTETKKCAFIRLLDPAAANPTEVEPLDMEVALVHELYHVKLHALSQPEGSHRDIVQEQAIHAISKHAVQMKRELRRLRKKRATVRPQ